MELGSDVFSHDENTLLLSKVTAPLRARALPSKFAPVVTVIEVSASMFPLNIESVPMVAELPTCQKILHGSALPMRITSVPDMVVSEDDGIWKMNTAFESPWASSVSSPADIAKELIPDL